VQGLDIAGRLPQSLYDLFELRFGLWSDLLVVGHIGVQFLQQSLEQGVATKLQNNSYELQLEITRDLRILL